MLRRSMLAVVAVLIVVLAMAGTAAAKTALTSQTVPDETTAGEPFTVRFSMENHEGLGLDTTMMKVVATSLSSDETLAFEALPENGTWSAELTLPTSGTWFLKVVNEDLGFQQDLAATTVKANPAAAVTSAQLDSAIGVARQEIVKEVGSTVDSRVAQISTDLTALEQKVESLTTQRDQLQAQVTTLQQQVDAVPQDDAFSPWLAALTGAAVAALTLAGGFAVLNRRGALPRRTERATVTVRP